MKKIYFLLLCALPHAVFCALNSQAQEKIKATETLAVIQETLKNVAKMSAPSDLAITKPTNSEFRAARESTHSESTSKTVRAQNTVQPHSPVLKPQVLDLLKSSKTEEMLRLDQIEEMLRLGQIEDLLRHKDPAMKKELLGLTRSNYAWRGCFKEMFFAAMKHDDFEIMTALAEKEERQERVVENLLLRHCSEKEIAEAAFKRNNVDFMNKFLKVPNILRWVREYCQMMDKNKECGAALSFILSNDYDQALRGCFNNHVHLVCKEGFSLPTFDKEVSDNAVTCARGKGALMCVRIIQAYSALKSKDKFYIHKFSSALEEEEDVWSKYAYANALIDAFEKMVKNSDSSVGSDNTHLRNLIIYAGLLRKCIRTSEKIETLLEVFHPYYLPSLILTLAKADNPEEMKAVRKILSKVSKQAMTCCFRLTEGYCF